MMPSKYFDLAAINTFIDYLAPSYNPAIYGLFSSVAFLVGRLISLQSNNKHVLVVFSIFSSTSTHL